MLRRWLGSKQPQTTAPATKQNQLTLSPSALVVQNLIDDYFNKQAENHVYRTSTSRELIRNWIAATDEADIQQCPSLFFHHLSAEALNSISQELGSDEFVLVEPQQTQPFSIEDLLQLSQILESKGFDGHQQALLHAIETQAENITPQQRLQVLQTLANFYLRQSEIMPRSVQKDVPDTSAAAAAETAVIVKEDSSSRSSSAASRNQHPEAVLSYSPVDTKNIPYALQCRALARDYLKEAFLLGERAAGQAWLALNYQVESGNVFPVVYPTAEMPAPETLESVLGEPLPYSAHYPELLIPLLRELSVEDLAQRGTTLLELCEMAGLTHPIQCHETTFGIPGIAEYNSERQRVEQEAKPEQSSLSPFEYLAQAQLRGLSILNYFDRLDGPIEQSPEFKAYCAIYGREGAIKKINDVLSENFAVLQAKWGQRILEPITQASAHQNTSLPDLLRAIEKSWNHLRECDSILNNPNLQKMFNQNLLPTVRAHLQRFASELICNVANGKISAEIFSALRGLSQLLDPRQAQNQLSQFGPIYTETLKALLLASPEKAAKIQEHCTSVQADPFYNQAAYSIYWDIFNETLSLFKALSKIQQISATDAEALKSQLFESLQKNIRIINSLGYLNTFVDELLSPSRFSELLLLVANRDQKFTEDDLSQLLKLLNAERIIFTFSPDDLEALLHDPQRFEPVKITAVIAQLMMESSLSSEQKLEGLEELYSLMIELIQKNEEADPTVISQLNQQKLNHLRSLPLLQLNELNEPLALDPEVLNAIIDGQLAHYTQRQMDPQPFRKLWNWTVDQQAHPNVLIHFCTAFLSIKDQISSVAQPQSAAAAAPVSNLLASFGKFRSSPSVRSSSSSNRSNLTPHEQDLLKFVDHTMAQIEQHIQKNKSVYLNQTETEQLTNLAVEAKRLEPNSPHAEKLEQLISNHQIRFATVPLSPLAPLAR